MGHRVGKNEPLFTHEHLIATSLLFKGAIARGCVKRFFTALRAE
jgi:hypothetical protein